MIFRRFKSDESGNMATMFAVSTAAILLALGVAVDTAGILNAKSKLQNAADTAALAAAVSSEYKAKELEAVATDSFAENYSGEFDLNLELENSGESLRVEVSANYPMMFGALYSDSKQTINVDAGALSGAGRKLNLALALDTTLSMEGARMSAMISAAADLVDSVEEADKNLGNAKVAVIPFADYVRIDRNYLGEPWLDAQPDHVTTWERLDEGNSTNCRQEGSGELISTVCDSYVFETLTSTASWNGCMVSRPDGLHKVAAYGSRPFLGNAGSSTCNWENNVISPLSRDFKDVKADIETLTPRGKTYIPAGLIWAWRALEEEQLFTDEIIEEDEETQKVLLLMTDGSNTVRLNDDPKYEDWDGIFHWGSSIEDDNRINADALTLEICDSVKAAGIRLITVAYEVEEESTKTLLETCASTGADFYDVSEVSLLAGAFGKIGSGFKNVRLTY